MAVVSGRSQLKEFNNIQRDGVATQVELDEAVLSLENQIQQSSSLAEGWKDNIMPFNASFVPPQDAPTFVYLDNGIGYFQFSDNKDNHTIFTFHIDHDYKLNSLIYPHIHWSPNSISTGNVHWRFEYMYAKGHSQNDLVTKPLQTIDLIVPSTGNTGEHIVTECLEADAFIVPEPDTIVTIKVSRIIDDLDTFVGGVLGINVDLHYLSDRETTPGKAPDFYSEV